MKAHQVFARRRTFVASFFAVLLLTSVGALGQRKVDWRTATSFPNLSLKGLSVQQYREAISQLRSANCPCGCKMKIAQCLIDDPSCPKSPSIARNIVASIRNKKVDWRSATSFPGVNMNGMSAAQRLRALRELRSRDCTCGCNMKIAQCLIDDPSCKTSPGIARKILQTARQTARGRLHAIIVSDHLDKKIGVHCAADGFRMSQLLWHNIDNASYVQVNSAELRADRILQQIRSLKVGSNDTVLFYYSGHGAYTKESGQFFALPKAPRLLKRRDVRNAIKSLKPRLGVLISDCCYALVEFKVPSQVGGRVANDKTRTLMHSLFFQESGFVDITSSKRGQLSFCVKRDPTTNRTAPSLGGTYTTSFLRVIYDNMDRPLSWNDLHRRAVAATENRFRRDFPNGIKSGQIASLPNHSQASQTPYAFSLGKSRLRLGLRGKTADGGVVITEVYAGSPAGIAGLEPGDVILYVDGRRTATYNDFSDEVDEAERDVVFRIRNANGGAVSDFNIKMAW